MNDPVLKITHYVEQGINYRLTIKGGLHYLRTNKKPYFSITAKLDRMDKKRWREDSCGCLHDEILKHVPKFAGLVALHLSDIDGVPMYAVDNGFYHAGGCGATDITEAGYIAAALERTLEMYHRLDKLDAVIEAAGIKYMPRKVWKRYENTGNADTLAQYLRVDLDTAALLCADVMAKRTTKEQFAQFVDQQKPRWKREADAAIRKHGLVIYGDTYYAKEAV